MKKPLPKKADMTVDAQAYQILSQYSSTELEFVIAQFKSHFEKMGETSFILARQKQPDSIARKFHSDLKHYSIAPETIKDRLGFMIVVPNSEEGVKISTALQDEFKDVYNPHSKRPVVNTSFNPPSPKGYSTEDGYKYFRLHAIIGDIPTEIQVQTLSQFVAHEATHDPTYKAPELDDDEKRFVSDKFYPYFDALAYLQLTPGLTPERKAEIQKDIDSIYNRNKAVFTKYPEVFRNASVTFASYCFIAKNYSKVFADATFRDSVLETKFIEGDLGRVFRYVNKDIATLNPQMPRSKVFQRAVTTLSNMEFEQFQNLNTLTEGNFRKGIAAVYGTFGRPREKDVTTINLAANNHKEVYVGVYSDEFAEKIDGVKPTFSQDQRAYIMGAQKNVAGTFVIYSDGKVELPTEIVPIETELEEEKKYPYDVVYISGVFDNAHVGHIDHIGTARPLGVKVIAGVKTNEYVETHKHKTPIDDEQDRLAFIGNMKGVDQSVLTDNVLLPPPEVLEEMRQVVENGGTAGVIVGSDVAKKPREELSEEVQQELAVLDELGITIQLPGEREKGVSSTDFREHAERIKEYDFTNHTGMIIFPES